MNWRRVSESSCLAALLACLLAMPATAAITTRVQEPVVLKASQFPSFNGIPVDRIAVYRYAPGELNGWREVPSQVDEVVRDNIDSFYAGTSCSLGQLTCELGYRLAGVVGDGFTSAAPFDDELSFMPRDGGDAALNTGVWVGVPGVDTLNTRYVVTIVDPLTLQTGRLYVYAWLHAPDHVFGPTDDYVTWTQGAVGEPCKVAGDPACGWLRSTDLGSIGARSRFNLFFAGNWTTAAMCVKPYATDTSCTAGTNTSNFLDETKWRTENPDENEDLWDKGCRALAGVKDGPVRVIRKISGAHSGRYTTKTEFFYGTWMEQRLNLRVHQIGSVTLWDDHRVPDLLSPPGESPSLLFTKTYSSAHDSQAMDVIDGAMPGASIGAPGDWVQVDTARGTYVQFIEEKRVIPNALRSFTYRDNRFGGSGLDNQSGEFGQHGMKWSGTPCLPDMDDLLCSQSNPDDDANLRYARLVRTWIPLFVDTPDGLGIYRSDEAEAYDLRRLSPLTVAPVAEQFNANPPSPVGPCIPVVSGTTDPGGFSTSLTTTTNCSEADAVGTMLYRGLSPGIYSFVADLKKSGTYLDTNVVNGTTYRYVSRAYNMNGVLGPLSAELALNVVDATPPPVPTGVSAVPGSSQIVISWTPPTDRDTKGFFVNLAQTENGAHVRMNVGDPVTCNGSTYTIVGLTAGHTYYINVTAVDAVGNESQPSLEVSATPTP